MAKERASGVNDSLIDLPDAAQWTENVCRLLYHYVRAFENDIDSRPRISVVQNLLHQYPCVVSLGVASK